MGSLLPRQFVYWDSGHENSIPEVGGMGATLDDVGAARTWWAMNCLWLASSRLFLVWEELHTFQMGWS